MTRSPISYGLCAALFATALALAYAPGASAQAAAPTVIHIDTSAQRHPISPLIYGVAFGNAAQLQGLNCPLNRSGGNATTRYNWQQNASNHAADWYFDSLPEGPDVPGGSVDDFIGTTHAAGAQAMITMPMIGWVAKLGPNRAKLWSFSVKKYGPQQKNEPGWPDIGNGVKPDGTNITGNDPLDANMPVTVAFQKPWVTHLINKWGLASHGGVRYYLMDNEPGLWNSTHRDVHPQGETMDEELSDIIAYAGMIKDQGSPDKDAHGGMDFVPWLLQQLHQYQLKNGTRLLDVCSVHMYPQGGDGGDDVSPKIQLLRNRSTRSLWDPNYKDESWINANIMLIPRLKQWVAKYYPGTKIGITEYDWGAEGNIGGATAQADILGIFGREGLDLATRWTAPKIDTPVFKSMQMYRNYDGKDSDFGDVSVADTVPNPDAVASFAALRSSDHALTVMVINKGLDAAAPVTLALSHFHPVAKTAQAWQLTSANTITRLPDVSVSTSSLSATLPAQSITLFIVPGR
jgi:hypothetical protein